MSIDRPSGRVQSPCLRGSGDLIFLHALAVGELRAILPQNAVYPTIINRDSGNLVNPFMRVTN
jgi:hypothetical protein